MPRNRSLPPHLEIRSSGDFSRRRLPKALQSSARPLSSDQPEAGNVKRSKKTFLCFALRSHLLRDAKILARRLTEMTDQVFAANAETIVMIAPDIQERLLESLARFEIEAFERARLCQADFLGAPQGRHPASRGTVRPPGQAIRAVQGPSGASRPTQNTWYPGSP